MGREFGRDSLLEDVLSHYGTKGMKWGKRKIKAAPARSSADAAAARRTQEKIKKTGGVHTVSNKDPQHLVNRMNLEQQYSRLNSQPSTLKRGNERTKEILAVVGTAKMVASLLSPQAKAVAVGLTAASIARKNRRSWEVLA